MRSPPSEAEADIAAPPAGVPTERMSGGSRLWLAAPRFWRYWLRYVWRLRIRNRHIRTHGIVFLARSSEVFCRRGLGHLEFGRFVWIGDRTAIRCHEGFMRIGDKVVFGIGDTVNGYLDIEIGGDCIVADTVYVTDFDHRFDDPAVPIRKQGIVRSPVRVGPDCWIGEKASILRGSAVGRGSVIGAQTVVRGEIPPYSVAVGNPARVVKRRATG